MRKNISSGIFLIVMILMIIPLGYCDWFLHDYTETERQAKYEEADLVFDGSFVDVRALKGGETLNATLQDPSIYKSQEETEAALPFVITLNVDKVIKGAVNEKIFTIWIHSPALQFGVDYDNIKGSQGKRFRIYTINTPNGRIIIGQEALAK